LGSPLRIRHVAAIVLPIASLFLLVLLMPEVALAAGIRDGFRDGLQGIADADPLGLTAAGLLLATSLAGSALAWRAAFTACRVPCGRVDAIARYGIGSLANALLPTRIGGLLRIALFSRLVKTEGAVWTTGGAAAVAGIARSLWLAALIMLASTTGVLPAWPAAVLVGVALLGLGAALTATRTRFHARAAHVLDAFSALLAAPRAAAGVLLAAAVSIGARVAAVASLAIAFGVERPLTAGLLAVAAIELVAMLPISIGGAGMAGGALAFAFAAHGAPAGVPVAAGMALAAVETATAVTVGGLGGLFLALPLLARWLRPAPLPAPLAVED